MKSKRANPLMMALAGACVLSLWSTQAWAFCGFYVSGATQEMYNEATMVVMMREGTKTVLSMRNDYQGPAEDFAMVVPVPEVLKEKQVKTLSDELFVRVDSLAAPRLVEYWEQDPCNPPVMYEAMQAKGAMEPPTRLQERRMDRGVKIEAQFKVGEYDIVILSAGESSGLESWLLENKYNIPKGAKEVLAPYIAAGQYFFVAKVDPQKVSFSKEGRALLSPLRFDYDSKAFTLPVRLGLLNARGPQDLLVHILAKGQRYEVANMKNMPIPTNLVVTSSTRDHFPQFYTSLIDATLEAHPGTVLTEYAWDASTCDPCPTTPLEPQELASLGADVMPDRARPARRRSWGGEGGWTLTRLHARYTKEEMTQDLVFAQAPPLVGGRGMPSGVEGTLEEKTQVSGPVDNFQGRYVMLNPWEGETKCQNPVRGTWGGPPSGGEPTTRVSQQLTATAGVKKEVQVAGFIARDVPEFLGKAQAQMPVKVEETPVAAVPEETKPVVKEPKKNSCASSGLGALGGGFGAWVLLGAGLLVLRRRSREG